MAGPTVLVRLQKDRQLTCPCVLAPALGADSGISKPSVIYKVIKQHLPLLSF